MQLHIRARSAVALFIPLFLHVYAPIAAAQAPDFSTLDAVAQQELKDTSLPGATVAVVSGGRVIYTKGYGTANVETNAPMTPDLLFRLGSTTKMFTAAALASLADRGAVDLRKPVGDYIKGLHPSIARVTGHQLLSHTSGILDEAPMHGSHDETALMNNVLSWKEDRFFTEPGRIYSYSNPGYWLAGALIEAVSGKLYADQLHETIFAPLGMTRTTLRPTVAMTYPLAQGHDVVDGKAVVVRPFANNAASWPAGSIFSSADDLARFVVAFVGGGRVDGKQAIAPKVIEMLSTPSARIPGSNNEYAYGLNVSTQRGVRVIQHGGSRSGYGSGITMVPEKQFGVIFLGNRGGASLPRTARKAMDIVLALPAPTTDAAGVPAPLTEQEMAAYAGVYSQGPRTMEVVRKDGKLFLKQGARETEMRRTAMHRFAPNLFFVAGADGKIEYLHSGGRSWRKAS
jgi:CubicO group peptidase (beta-lactamase class C family)